MLRAVTLVLALCSLGGCEDQAICEEDIRAQQLDSRVQVSIGEASVSAELANDANERERGWKHRQCDLEALLLVPDEPSSALGIWGCALSTPLDAYFIKDGLVGAVERIEPCPEPCGACPLFGEQLLIDAVLELPAGTLGPNVQPGASVSY